MEHPRILDWRDRQTAKNARAACKRDGSGRVVMRDPASIVGVTLHQTACWYKVAPFQLSAAKGDEELARHTRALGVHAHVTAMRHGFAVVGYDPRAYVWHGDLLNPEDVGLEHEGHYSADGEPIGMPGGVDVGEIIEAGRAALSWLVEVLPSLRYVNAHRQARTPPKAPKAADPGRRIFREVGIEHGVRKLGLAIRPERALGNGLPLPDGWWK